jgi:DNA repair protein RecN (Recombination protein N)
MLTALAIRDVVLIDRLDLDWAGGLCALTGETGAGKSILLDALGLALGARGDAALVARGAAQASVTASFEPADAHPVWALLDEQGVARERPLVLRRIVGADGRSRAYLNDQPVSVGLLRRVGDLLVEVHGQHESLGLLDAARHRAELDAFAGLDDKVGSVEEAWSAYRRASEALAQADAEARRARSEEDYLRHVRDELSSLAPRAGEAEALAAERTFLQQGEKLAGALSEAQSLLGEDDGVTRRLAAAARLIGRVADKAAGRLDPLLAQLDKAASEAADAVGLLDDAARALGADPTRLEKVEDRLFALRAAARKHQVEPDKLSDVLAEVEAKLASIEGGDAKRRGLADLAAATKAAYAAGAEALSSARKRAAGRLDKAVVAELEPLKLGAARFRTEIAVSDEAGWGPMGMDRVAFAVATNSGQPFGPLAKIASGGELARFTLALKVVLAAKRGPTTLVFDEVDTGIGGATADAVGERLARLADGRQVLVVTHSPQVAARAHSHYRVAKAEKAGKTSTRVEALDEAARREEVARMLAGATVTKAARAAADSLIAARGR